jgi:acid phosphatase family membrane protein YuiD
VDTFPFSCDTLDMVDEAIFIILPLIVTVFTQVIKVIVKAIQRGRLEMSDYFAWGGFPSSHIALVSSLCTGIALWAGLFSPEFAIALVFSVIVARDALGLRMFVQQHSLAINYLRSRLPKDEQKKIPLQQEHVGHTSLEALGGAVIGIGTTLLVGLALGFF